MLTLLMMTALATGAAGDSWHDQLSWRGQRAHMAATASGYVLSGPFGQRDIGTQAMRVDTASTLFNGLFAMAQDDLVQDSVTAIRDGAFDHGQPIPCTCFETGVKWPYVWTRDLSYSVDLGLWKIDPLRARNGLRFKLSDVRDRSLPQGLYVMQDTGSGGSWPISTDRVVWFLAAQHLLDEPAFAQDTYRAIVDTLKQDRLYTFDPDLGLYRGETSFLDWREQTYPAWTADNVVFIAQSFALSTNVLHYQALQLAAHLAQARAEQASAKSYADKAAALKAAINARFWRTDRGMYMSYIGGDGTPYDTYDLLGTALAITSGVAEGDRARQALAHYPTWPAGTPVIWPERKDQPIYHNRAIWPFVSAYALRAARAVDDPARIEHELRSIMRGAALSGSNMENYELVTQSTHVDEGKLSGPVVDSPRQLWSVAAYLDAVSEGVFGLTQDGNLEPKLPVALVPMLFGDRDSIALRMPERSITLRLPRSLHGNLLVAAKTSQQGNETVVTLKAIDVSSTALRTDAPLYAPAPPAAPVISADGKGWRVAVDGKVVLYADGQRVGRIDGNTYISQGAMPPCVSATREGEQGIESLHSPVVCAGEPMRLADTWPRNWTAPAAGRYRIALSYENNHGPINTGVTAAVKMLVMHCSDGTAQRVPIVMPHSVGEQRSTYGIVTVKAGVSCHFALEPGFNMSELGHFAHFTGGKGGSDGPLNDARVGELLIAPAADTP